jgi:SynChlorMet cassette protein ScmC
VAVLVLADGSTWRIAGVDHVANVAVQRLSDIMRLPLNGGSDVDFLLWGGCSAAGVQPEHWIAAARSDGTLVRFAGDRSASSLPLSIRLLRHGGRCEFQAPVSTTVLHIQLSIVAQAIARQTQERGGLLLHGALAELDGRGVVLAGPSGAGKTTASHRLPPPWSAHSDDSVLVVGDTDGRYWAHPWPTWSRFGFTDDIHHSWDVSHAVPLAGVCFLNQSAKNRLTVLRPGPAATLLVQSAEQAAMSMPYTSLKDRVAKRIERLDVACALAGSVPAYALDISRAGEFWRLLETVVAGCDDVCRPELQALAAAAPAATGAGANVSAR